MHPSPSTDLSRAAALAADAADPLAGFRARFTGTDDDGPDRLLYLDGNSLGRLPVETPAAVARAVEQEWGQGLVGSWADWIGHARRIGDLLAAGVLGARPGEVLVSDSTSIDLYKLLVAAADARPGRDVLVCCADDFPTDRYVVAGVAEQRGMTVREVEAHVDEGLDPGVLAAALDERVAVVVLSQVAYRSGALVDVAEVTRLARAAGALVVWDLSHGAGAVPAELTAAGADLAVGCTYKHLNGGPGAPAFLYVRRELQDQLRQPIWGWFGQRDQFAMGPAYEPAEGVDRFAVGTPPVLAMAAVEVGVRITAEAGVERIAAKGRALTGLVVELADAWLAEHGVSVASPRDPARRGAHVSLTHPAAWQLTQALIDRGVVPDFRTPDRLRLGPAPLYTRFVDVWDAMARLRTVVADGSWTTYPTERARVT
ncbi:kynureninase [Modestobacter roseus]|uniref:Kynureninase n=1 Tax=Modestobacter roseus TaxID=1181884 RepID=A0A562IM96_9ACTN|nr:kynureninase [Modestobacter roseus]MQA33786.1 kynureninase [Modestobacter roseus]TWH72028.1 kynureninase [Modestobacter roseus]